jgi:hypothetical protein
MLIEATKHPIRYTMLDGRQVCLAPGCPVDLPEERAQALLTKAPDRVRLVAPRVKTSETFLVEPASCQHPVFWESHDKRILGPGLVTHVAKETRSTHSIRFWLCVAYGGSWRWIHESLLRSRAKYEAQRSGMKSSCKDLAHVPAEVRG